MTGLGETAFLDAAASRYAAANAAALRWMLDRPPLAGGFLNTRMNPVTLQDYGPQDGMRGPGFVNGWIQGRGLEALAGHAAFFAAEDPALAARLDAAARGLHARLSALVARDGRVFFCYGAGLAPVRPQDGVPVPQTAEPGVRTYSDAFAAKGLVAAGHRLGLEAPDAYLADVVAAIGEGRFQMDETAPLTRATAAAQPDDYGPRMILLGAAAMLRGLGRPGADFAEGFVAHVLARHLDPGTGLLRDGTGGARVNPGHAIEFVGFALEALPDPDLPVLERILTASFEAGFKGPGIALFTDLQGTPLAPQFPWWSLPEAIRAAALLWQRTRSPQALRIWQAADAAFFAHFWRGDPPVAYQARTLDGPLDFVPATPDLDPGYHTGLSLLAALRVARSPETEQ